MSLTELMKHFGVGSATLTDWLRGIAPPEWTRRPNAKDELRAQAVVLREQGWSVNDLAGKLGVAKSTAWSWVKHIPLDPDSDRARQKQEHSALMNAERWEAHNAERTRRERDERAKAVRELGEITERDVLVGGALVYMCEGAKAKPWRRLDRLKFINSDPRLHRLFLAFLALHGRGPETLRYRVHIHETADAEAAGDWWSERLEVPRELFERPTIKRHNPATRRMNTGADYHGCLIIAVPRSRELYWRIEGVMEALDASG
ncbi:helix-turn-helix domain-containing protein [Actinoplanes sp. TBRC 11911]|uniref:helix-turn-helix domain-containing protein n=1 Tax=Actinoplanes sp. TBRC 11911 TaxID=2729386 RepID=UPI0020071187|nr:helix-turn-helix domain-containing protein [Actinoplanes sp. TBRC 11911]